MSKKPRDYHEPWKARRSSAWSAAFRFGPPAVREGGPFTRDDVLAWEAAKIKAEERADWVIEGERMSEPEACVSLEGAVAVTTNVGIIAVSHGNARPGTGPDHEAIARRIASCVNAMRAVADPEDTMRRVRATILALAKGEIDGRDDRVFACLARMIPAEELEAFEGREGMG